MGLPSQVADGAWWALAVVFALAAAEKAETLLHRAAAWHPVILARARWRRQAVLLISTSLLADVAVVALLVIRPAAGGLLAAALLVAYSLAASGVHTPGGEDCRCLWKVLRTRTWRGLLARNLALLSLAGLAAVRPESFSIRGVAAGAVLGGALLGVTLLLTMLADRVGDQRARKSADPGHARGELREAAADVAVRPVADLREG